MFYSFFKILEFSLWYTCARVLNIRSMGRTNVGISTLDRNFLKYSSRDRFLSKILWQNFYKISLFLSFPDPRKLPNIFSSIPSVFIKKLAKFSGSAFSITNMKIIIFYIFPSVYHYLLRFLFPYLDLY